MAPVKKHTNFLDIEIEVQDLIFENLFSQMEILHIPEAEGATISALCGADKTLRAKFTEYEAERQERASIRKRYTKCVFTASPVARAAPPSSPRDWPHIRDVEIIIDDLALNESYQDTWFNDPEVVRGQVAGMVADLEAFVAWAPVLREVVAPSGDGLSAAPVLQHLLTPLIMLPSCDNTIVKQSEDAMSRLQGFMDGEERIEDVSQEYEISFKLAVQCWLKQKEGVREREVFDRVAEDLADEEWYRWTQYGRESDLIQ
ncbi:hypothetical protein M409DRAFT_49884 [Zasmidium cellare ATCC 36951]|uniref:Uncharacterized protein n=1 Tax=Zasmidium cellare ATCC 36951 TaxID=1080233 RepID=A0A6A6CYM8_ZASCE|nr:uncharacterized protein M409DRAFT_49884 [Zasmidium cellare ATCC 36951]KAF2172145.1 hypothetical protein M409DRAFT_49884 [Zasmidium cellare ATCC 36951]